MSRYTYSTCKTVRASRHKENFWKVVDLTRNSIEIKRIKKGKGIEYLPRIKKGAYIGAIWENFGNIPHDFRMQDYSAPTLRGLLDKIAEEK